MTSERSPASAGPSGTVRNDETVQNLAWSQRNEALYLGTVNNYNCAHDVTGPPPQSPAYVDRDEDDRSKIIESLCFFQLEAREHSIGDAQKHTAEWLLSHGLFTTWLDHDRSSLDQRKFLWLKGKPGAGKSTITKHIYKKLKRRATLSSLLSSSMLVAAIWKGP